MAQKLTVKGEVNFLAGMINLDYQSLLVLICPIVKCYKRLKNVSLG
jgi:hypothetical protein